MLRAKLITVTKVLELNTATRHFQQPIIGSFTASGKVVDPIHREEIFTIFKNPNVIQLSWNDIYRPLIVFYYTSFETGKFKKKFRCNSYWQLRAIPSFRK